MWEVKLNDQDPDPHTTQRPGVFSKLIALWIPRQFITTAGIDVSRFIADVNEKVTRRGFILCDGQVLNTPITDTIDRGIFKPKSQRMPEIENSIWKVISFTNSMRVGKHTELFCPQVAPDFEHISSDFLFDVPPRSEWQAVQADYFGLESPYQMAEDADEYTEFHIMTRDFGPYLMLGERIAAILHCERDNYYFYCPCHEAAVVYTTRHRLVCMGCGALHAVLCQPLPVRPKRLLTAEEWDEYFHDEGRRRDDEIKMSVVDFQDVENSEMIWTTYQWDEAREDFIFFARSSPEEIAQAARGTEEDPSVFLEAGWTPVETAPPPANQVADDSIDLDLIENAAHSICEGVSSFLKARKNPERLVSAIPHFFRAVEVILKAKLKDLDAHSLYERPDNPTVLRRLVAMGVFVDKDELDNVGQLRLLRNKLQHGAAKFNYRTGLAVTRKAIVFLNRFSHAELGLWMGDAVPSDDWYQLLAIPEIARTAEEVANRRLDEIRQHSETTVSACSRCGKEAMVRSHLHTGASCIICGYIPGSKSSP